MTQWPECTVGGCHQHQTKDSVLCGDHLAKERIREAADGERQGFLDAIEAATSLDDLKAVLTDLVKALP